MVSSTLGNRMHRLQQRLVDIRIGTGALILPKDIKRIHLRFAFKGFNGHVGPKKFWRNELVRLKYHNPAIPMTIDRSIAQTDQALLSVHFAPADAKQTSESATSSPAATDSTTSSSSPSDAATTERVETIDMTHITNAQILEAFVGITNAYPVEPTAQDLEEMNGLEELKVKGERDRKRSLEIKAKLQREKELLEQARGDMTAQT